MRLLMVGVVVLIASSAWADPALCRSPGCSVLVPAGSRSAGTCPGRRRANGDR